ncbi:MAG: hypothetical protein KGI38_12560 [Thaumarchaeota archaeon]|nr:hypothetical protein [Nitrososphaerota archaeon]
MSTHAADPDWNDFYDALIKEGLDAGTAIGCCELAKYLLDDASRVHPLALRRWKQTGIINPKGKVVIASDLNDEESGSLSWLLAAQVFQGDLRMKMKNGQPSYQITPQGKRKVEGMGVKA